MPLFKFASGIIVDRFSGNIVPGRPVALGELIRTGQTIEANLVPDVPFVFCFFGFTSDILTPYPSVLGAMQDEFFCELYQTIPLVDGSFDQIGIFVGNIIAISPSVATGDSFFAELQPGKSVVSGGFRDESMFLFNNESLLPAVNGSFLQINVFSAQINSYLTHAGGSFYIASSLFGADVLASGPVVFGNFSLIGQFGFGSEVDVILNNKASRRYI